MSLSLAEVKAVWLSAISCDEQTIPLFYLMPEYSREEPGNRGGVHYGCFRLPMPPRYPAGPCLARLMQNNSRIGSTLSTT